MTTTNEIRTTSADVDTLREELADILLKKTGVWKAVYWRAITEIIERGWRPTKTVADGADIDDDEREVLREELADILLEKTEDFKATYWRAIDLILERGWRPTK